MDASKIFELVMQQGIWAVLFVWLLMETRKESKSREDKLYIQIGKYDEKLDKQGNALIQITDTLTRINQDLQAIKEKIEE